MRTSSMEATKVLFIVTGAVAIMAGILPVAGTLLLSSFGYPEIIREIPQVILEKLNEASNTVPYFYYLGIGGAGIGLFFLMILLSKIFQSAGDNMWSSLGKYCGMVDGLCLYGGIIRWTFLFPLLAKFRAEGSYEPKTIDLVFKSFNTYIGDSIAEHVGFTFMFLWILFMSLAILKTKIISKWIGIAGIISSLIVFYGNLEFFGAPGAFLANRIGAEIAALWGIILGIYLLCIRNKKIPVPQ